VPMQIHHGPVNRSKLSARKVAAYAGLAVGAVVLACVLVLLLFPDTYINGTSKNKSSRDSQERIRTTRYGLQTCISIYGRTASHATR